MAITAATVTGDFDSGFLPPTIAQPIFEKAARMSVAQSLVRQVPLAANGVTIPVVTGKMSAGWVAEAGQKPASEGAVGIKSLVPEKIAAIAVVSAETVRANPAGYMDMLRPQIAEAFAVAFDYAAFHDLGPDGTGTGPFTTDLDDTTSTVEIGTGTTIYNDFTASLSTLANAGKDLNGFALDTRLEALILDAVDGSNRPIFIDSPPSDTVADGGFENTIRRGRMIGRPSYLGRGVGTPDGTTVVGYAGDWSQCAWGVVGGISYDVSTEATVTINSTLTSLWEYNLVAIRAEAEYAWLVNDTASFVKFTNAV